MKKHAIIVAGGSGSRMKCELPKQFIELNKQPILMHTISAFFYFDNDINIVVVLPENQIEFWQELCEKHTFYIPHTIVKGGKERFHSVKNGIEGITEGVVAIHDGVRPLVSKATLERCFTNAEQKGNAIPVIDIVETLRAVRSNSSKTVDRNKYKLVQTPQCFTAELIKNAYNQDFNTSFTDDASVVETMGIQINLVEGNRENIKITTPNDLIIAQAYKQQL